MSPTSEALCAEDSLDAATTETHADPAAGQARKQSAQNMRRLMQERSATLDALPAHIVLLDQAGTVVYVNKIWRDTAAENGVPGAMAEMGSDYALVCEAVLVDGQDMAQNI